MAVLKLPFGTLIIEKIFLRRKKILLCYGIDAVFLLLFFAQIDTAKCVFDKWHCSAIKQRCGIVLKMRRW